MRRTINDGSFRFGSICSLQHLPKFLPLIDPFASGQNVQTESCTLPASEFLIEEEAACITARIQYHLPSTYTEI